MCHGITWYHALCLHPNPTSSVRITCTTALKSGYDCCMLEAWTLPMVGACPICTAKVSSSERFGFASESNAASAMVEELEYSNASSENDEDESYFSDTNSESSIAEMDEFDRVTF